MATDNSFAGMNKVALTLHFMKEMKEKKEKRRNGRAALPGVIDGKFIGSELQGDKC